MTRIWQDHKGSVIALGIALLALLSSIVIVPETHQAVIIQGGRPDRVANQFQPDAPYGETGAGIVLRIPGYERVQMIDKRILDLDMERQQVLSSDQQRLQVDAYARFRIIDPVLTVENAGSEEILRTQLSPILTSVLRQELGRRSFASLLTAERGTAMANIRDALDREARSYGAQIIDVRIKRADLPDGAPLAAAFTRMRTDREEEAATIRAQGQKNAQIIRAEAEADAASTYAAAYGKDPEFYDFYRAMESYRRTFEQGEGESTMILSPDNEYLRQFQGQR
ncbi:protease modulator HflC [Pelagerythrobacter aerophilus]|uniref:Protein HflC n=1 Tax=Pelagerythrobacter aerophilus TaxID=2306995 RepID=A0A418NF30_9SPHN|nr:protease modulator HflC [Pelagerythrobacter aerophilus]RIV76965.1 protease modulator HflC [Pelagerythrobacter aerophilus]